MGYASRQLQRDVIEPRCDIMRKPILWIKTQAAMMQPPCESNASGSVGVAEHGEHTKGDYAYLGDLLFSVQFSMSTPLAMILRKNFL